MTLRISGKNVDIGEALREHAQARIDDAVAKYFDGGYSGHVTIEPEGAGFKSECMIHLDTGMTLQAQGSAHDAYQSFDQAADRVEKRLRRYKRRLKDHHHNASDKANGLDSTQYVLQGPQEDEDVHDDFNPVVIAETNDVIRTMTVGMAVLDLDLTGAPVSIFRSAAHGGINVVYRRADGNFGWIDPKNGDS